MNNPIAEIKDRLSIVDVVSTYIRVEKSGTQYKARCPFHNEKTPSFYISPSRNSYHCFGCSKGGDIFSFVEEIEHIPFREALILLADRAGVALSDYKKTETDSSLISILEDASKFYENELERNPAAKLYLKDRGISDKTKEIFNLGFAPLEWRTLYTHLSKLGYSEDSIEKSGVSIKTEKGSYDRFRGRIMFPILNTSGKAVGFTGRILPSVEQKSDVPLAKYVNTPETELYHKSKILYGYNIAKISIVSLGQAIVVEGQMDVLLSHQTGITNTVGVSGTAFTEEQIKLLKRLTNTVLFCFDTDQAGMAALKRSSELALLSEMDVYVIVIVDAKDPAELIQKGPAKWTSCIEQKVHVIEYFLGKALDSSKDQREIFKSVTKDVVPLISCITNKLDQAYFVKLVAEKLGISQEIIASEVDKGIRHAKEEVGTVAMNTPKTSRLENILKHYIGIRGLVDKNIEEDKILNNLPDEYSYYKNIPPEIENKLILEAENKYQNKTDLNKHMEEVRIEIEEVLLEYSLDKIRTRRQSAEPNEREMLEESSLVKKLHILRSNRKKNI